MRYGLILGFCICVVGFACGQEGYPVGPDDGGNAPSGSASAMGAGGPGGQGGTASGGLGASGPGGGGSSGDTGGGGSGSVGGGGSAGVGGSVGVGGGVNCGGGDAGSGGDPAVIVQSGTALLLRGQIVNPEGAAFAGEVLIEGDTITCVDASCAGEAAAATATIVDTKGIIMPGMIDTHNHILFDIFDESDWTPSRPPSNPYKNHNQWTGEAKYKAMVDAKQYINGEGSALDLGCEMNKYGELKALIAGTTSVVGSANPGDKKCYGSLSRTIDQASNDLGADKVQAGTLFPDTEAADSICSNLNTNKTDAYVIHVGEGVDDTSRKEFDKLDTITTTDGCLISPKTTIVHGTAFLNSQFTTMGNVGMSLVWSPKSNVFLYGTGTVLSKTADIPLARSKGINIALAPDWSLGGSVNLLDELRFAKLVSDSEWSGLLTAQELFQMVTINAAKALGLEAKLGSLAVNKKADVFVITGNTATPYAALLAATPREVRLVVVGGKVLYGDLNLASLGPANPGCEGVDVCCASKFVCVAETTATDKLNQTFAEIRDTLVGALQDYDDMNLTQWKWSPIAPLVKCQ